MNYRKDMEQSIKFIEDHIKSQLSPEIISSHIGYSTFHYCRIFLACYGMTVMAYVRCRRLSLAGHEIFGGAKITDVALTYGFETASGFSKAFRRHFNCSPSEYKGEILQMNGAAPTVDKETLMKHMRIEQRESFLIAGYAYKTSDEDVMSTKDVAALWDEVDMKGIETRLYAELNPPKHGEVGIFIPDATGAPQYMLGLIVDDFTNVKEYMQTLEIPHATYAVFTTSPVDMRDHPDVFAEIIKATWKGVFDFFDNHFEYTYDFGKRDFEFYDERCHSEVDPIMEIWVPVKKKGDI